MHFPDHTAPGEPSRSWFASIELAAPDPILGLNAQFQADPRPDKINLGVGVYVDEEGKTEALPSVLQAEKRLRMTAGSRGYLPMGGAPAFTRVARELAFGADLMGTIEERGVSIQTPGGTGALRVAGDFLQRVRGRRRLWVSTPTWANHEGIFAAAGHELQKYPYFDPASNQLDRKEFLEALGAIPAGDVVLLHGCCHNPTGVDPDPETWEAVRSLALRQGWLPLVDFAYQGFGAGLEADSLAIRAFAQAGVPLLVAQSFSKNFGLYRERTGALHLFCADREEADRVRSQVELAVRTNYSNPPAHGALVLTTILEDPALRLQWERELQTMRDRIASVRMRWVEAMHAVGLQRDFRFLTEQKGMFSFTGLTRAQVEELRERFAIYMVASGRVNVAGIREANLDAVVEAFRAVVR